MKIGGNVDIQITTKEYPGTFETFKVETAGTLSVSLNSTASISSLVNPPLSGQFYGAISPTSFSSLDNGVSSYLSRSFAATVPSEEYHNLLQRYESKYGISSGEFLSLWQEGKFKDNEEFNNWANLALLL